MPPKSQAQARFMRAVAGGKAKHKPAGLSQQEAQEYVSGHPTRDLPEHSGGGKMDEMPEGMHKMMSKTPPPPKAPARRR